MKKLHFKHVIELIKKLKSLEEQNGYLSQYLSEMVKENESLQGQISDLRITLRQAKMSLSEVMQQVQDEEEKRKKQMEDFQNQMRNMNYQTAPHQMNPLENSHIDETVQLDAETAKAKLEQE